MSIFGLLGKGFKAVGKVAVGAIKLGASVAGVSIPQPNSTSVATSVQPQGVYVGTTPTKSGFANTVDVLVDGINRINPHVSVDHTLDTKNSNLPSWLLPAGLGLAALMILKPSGRR